MRPRDFVLLCLICIVWGLNFVVTKWIVAGDGADFPGLPPLAAVALRFTLASVVLAPLLRPVPKNLPAVALIGLVFGAAHFGFIHAGFVTATPSAGAITIQLVVPFTAVLSVLMLRERVGPARIAGIVFAFLGVALIAFDPEQMALSIGILFIAMGAACGAWGTILVKQLAPMDAVRLQAWIVVVAAAPLLVLSAIFETGQVEAVMAGGWRLAVAMAFVVGLVTIFAHTGYVWLLKRYEASFIAPLTLMGPVWGVVFGITLAGDQVTARFLIGAAITLAGVAVVAAATGRRAAVLAGAPSVEGPRTAASDAAAAATKERT
jgi:O-acetylserine/cysteine efflux transporter